MDLERINIALRPRTDWEAVDLGLRLAQRHADLVFPMWYATSAPWALLIGALCIGTGNGALAILLFWWIKPMFERVLLHLYGRLIFDDRPARSELPRIALRQPFSAGWLRALTYRRLELARSFNLPVWQLELLRGEARRRRTNVLHLGSGGAAVLLSAASLALLILLYSTLVLLVVSFMVREVIVVDPYSMGEFISAMLELIDKAGVGWDVTGFAIYWLCEGIVAPFYVGAGFSLYLNRRTRLEAWDVEMQFRRALRRRGVTVAVLLALGTGLATPLDGTVWAQTPEAVSERDLIKQQIEEIVESDDFGRWETRTRWVPKDSIEPEEEEKKREVSSSSLAWLSALFGSLSEVLLWSLMIIGVGLVIAYRDRWLKYFQGTLVHRETSTATRTGLLMDEDQLPADVPAQVLALWRDGRQVEATSLLYRGTLTMLHRRHAMRVIDSDTEGDCVRRARATLSSDLAGFFARISRTWQGMAYAHLAPSTDEVTALCEEWPERMAATT